MECARTDVNIAPTTVGYPIAAGDAQCRSIMLLLCHSAMSHVNCMMLLTEVD